MTLILAVGNRRGVFESSDYQLTDRETGAPVTNRAGSKQLQASFKDIDLRLAFTGIAEVGAGSARQRTVDWLSGEMKTLSHDSQLQDICEALKRRSVAITKPHGLRGALELVLTVATVGKPFRIAVISNVDWRKRPPEAKPEFTVRVRTVRRPFRLISGYRDSVPILQRHRLRALAKDVDKPTADILAALGEINAIAASGSQGYVSEGCWVTSQTTDGRIRRSTGLNIGQNPGGIPSIHGDFDLSEFIGKNFRAAPGQEMRLIQTAGAICGPGDGTPVPAPTGEPRRFTLSGSSVTALLRSPSGDECASINIVHINCVLEMRCNEEVTVPFAKVTLNSTCPIGTAFPRPLFPWPHLDPALANDGTLVPRGWEYSVGYWIETAAHHVVIPQSSRSIRNVAFLGAEDEVIIVAPSTAMEFRWTEREEAPSATVSARVSWRSRLDNRS